MFDSILVVCTGNICRSPIGERILQNKFPLKHVASAGTFALVGKKADKSAEKIANKYGISLDGHEGRQFTAAIGHKYDLILVMEKSHIEYISEKVPEVRGKTMLLGHWLDRKEIPDPYGKSDEVFELVYKLIDDACRLWGEKIT
ncbi:protein tyrosine phosphatase [Escherichia coli]|uniref:arsenate reductase/protein-tyrosine-phosphatase family protein n=1 Tax=Escherichia TaxID=561 RepID=UPI000D028FD0|nr:MULTISPECIES: protein tyrosine phosphatase [Escherichia]EIW4430935.1 protein tyrosine phosphatase [Escherichia coli]EJA3211456.1 protein tyrosine phosphatase [Escherichia coli]EJE5572152.1 protein tyrosine phosphatase [Escherichia coli]EJZ8782423.1 protein tyrosine phosphatase [Escherichia coli]EKG9173440.1 protein tyrosine phosphatase [Escherichia coli]